MMFDPLTLNPQYVEFLNKSPQERLYDLQQLGWAGYADVLTQMPLTANNVRCVAHLLESSPNTDPTSQFLDLAEADLSGLVLDGTHLVRANLSGANLQGTRLMKADLRFANLSGANLADADLRGATLYQTVWIGAKVMGCRFDRSIGLTLKQSASLKRRGGLLKLAMP